MTLTMLVVAWLLTYLVHSTLLLGGAWVLSRTGVVRAAGAREVLWKVCLVGGLLTATVQSLSPGTAFPGRYWLPGVERPAASAAGAAALPAAGTVPARSAATRGFSLARIQPPIGKRTGSAAPLSSESSPNSNPQTPTPVFTWPAAFLGLWLVGALGLLVRCLVCRARVLRHLRSRRGVTDGPVAAMLGSLSSAARVRGVRLTVSPGVTGPVAIGTNEICLPEQALTSLTAAEQRAVLAHELAHLVRRDPVWLGIAVAVESVLFLQPLNRLARRRMQDAAEYLCDDWAVRHAGESLVLAKCLAAVATWIEPAAVPVSGMAEDRSQLLERVQRLLEGVQPQPGRGLRLAAPVAALALATVAFAAPGVAPPCAADGQAVLAGAAGPEAREGSLPARSPADSGDWATIRDGRVLVFRPGFAPRITGSGTLGLRRGGRAIELLPGQRLLVDGRPAPDGEAVPVSASSTLAIVDADGRTLWRIEPVRISSRDAGVMAAGALDDSVDARLDSLERACDSLRLVVGDLDAADIAMLSASAADIAREVAGDVQAEVLPHVAELSRLGERISARVAPRLARLGALIGGQVAAEISCAFDDRGLCDADSLDSSDSAAVAAPPSGKKLHRRP